MYEGITHSETTNSILTKGCRLEVHSLTVQLKYFPLLFHGALVVLHTATS